MLARSLGAVVLVCLVAATARGADHARPGRAAAKPAAPAPALRVMVPVMRTLGEAPPPMGFVDFCQRNEQECVSRQGRRDAVVLTPARMQRLAHVNAAINAMIQPISDADHYGVVEYWTIPKDRRGDCEDYVLEKKRVLIKHGWPESALLITVVNDEHNEGHAVLTIRTTQGDLILDNKNSKILPWYKTPYTYLKRQSIANPQVWVSIEPQSGAEGAIAAGAR